MYEVEFKFVGGTGMNTTLSVEAIERMKELFDAGKPVTICGPTRDTTVYPQNLLTIDVSNKPVAR
jgi:CRISPR/Cas system-associated protein Cas5 (RAMP superfamily)